MQKEKISHQREAQPRRPHRLSSKDFGGNATALHTLLWKLDGGTSQLIHEAQGPSGLQALGGGMATWEGGFLQCQGKSWPAMHASHP